MLRLGCTQLAVFALISVLLASPAVAQTATEPQPDDPSIYVLPPPTSPLALPTSPYLLPSVSGIPVDPPPAPPPLAGAAILTGLQWIERPEAVDFARLYPEEAQHQSVSGRAVLDCIVESDGRLSCSVVAEEPPGYNFGNATIRISRFFRLAPQTTDGTPTVGGRVRLPVRWVIG